MKINWKSSSKSQYVVHKKKNHFLFEYFYKISVVGKAEDWSYNVWNMNHINFF